MATNSLPVLVTEGAGFTASHVVKLLLEEGYRVRTTVSDLQQELQLRASCPDGYSGLEVMEAGLFQDQNWDGVVKGCRYVIHDVSTIPIPESLEEDFVQLHVECIRRLLQACADDGHIKRVVLTSSVSAIHDQSSPEPPFTDEEEKTKIYSEADWSHADSPGLQIFAKIITLVERAAWDFVRELPGEKRLELAVINPGLILGPLICGFPSKSLEIVQKLFDRTIQLVPNINICVADVRDVAQAHLKVMTLPSAGTHRHIVCTESVWWTRIANILATEFRPLGYRIPTVEAPYFLLWISSFFNKSNNGIFPRIGKECFFNNKRVRKI
ncbi:tetraketide alpha-pyrone reductase 2-like, partial [Limulus polyphemus]|uniref:Tetraketide alpha-pyrone reductase 2-like n=1 Tax=Limulus polyphemus TaxID=6850 RepID=A0ABM1SBV2_LIMPO